MLWEGHTALDIIYNRRHTKWGRKRISQIIGERIFLHRYSSRSNWAGQGYKTSRRVNFLYNLRDYYGLNGYCTSVGASDPLPLLEKSDVSDFQQFKNKGGNWSVSDFKEVNAWKLYMVRKGKTQLVADVFEEYMKLTLQDKYALVMKLNSNARLLNLIKRRG